MSTLGRTARAMIAETPMMKNLQCPEFMNIILNGQPTLAARFAQLDMKWIQDMVKGFQNEKELPAGLKKMIRDSDFYKIFLKASKLTRMVA